MPYGPHAPEEQLRRKARQRIADGRLPTVISRTMDAGYGSGATCNVCEHPIGPMQVEYEVKGDKEGSLLRFHLHCHSLWQIECVNSLSGRLRYLRHE